MILDAARAALRALPSPPFRGVLLKSLGLTLLALVLVWIGLKESLDWLVMPWFDQTVSNWPSWLAWLDTAVAIAAGVGIALALGLLISPVSALLAGFFLDDIAEVVERTDYPADPPGRALPTGQAIVLSLKFLGVVVAGNLLALLLLLVPGVNIAAFFVVNGYLLGREYFEFAALRFRPEAEAKELRRRNAGTVFLAGLAIAAFLAVPILNLATPLFAAALMVHLHKSVTRAEAARPLRA